MQRRSMMAAVLLSAVTACGGATPSASTPPSSVLSSESPAAVASSAADPIVGEWMALHDCDTIYALLTDAGLDEFVAEQIYGNELVPGVPPDTSELQDPGQPCAGAVDREHSHFFTADGAFGSRDFNGDQVDDGEYSLVDADTIVINGQEFQYRVDGDQLELTPEPVDISTCETKECRFMAAWVLLVGMPGTPWTRR